jgi:large subunit ribosomal protein L18
MKKTIRRRRLERKTDYKSRLALLKSKKPRLIVRKTNKYLIVQVVESDVAQDRVIAGLSSKHLLSKGWPKKNSGSLKSLQAAYLIGFALAKSLKGKAEELIFDVGMHRNITKSRLYAALKGALDASLNISHSPEVLPSTEELTKNEKLVEIFKKVKENL